MLTLQCLREERDRVISALAKRHVDAAATVDHILELDAQRRATQTELDQVLAESNALSRQIGGLMREGKKEEAEGIKARRPQRQVQRAQGSHGNGGAPTERAPRSVAQHPV